MYIDIGYSENRHIDTYIHIYSWDKGVQPLALSLEYSNINLYTVFGKQSNNYLNIRFYADSWCIVMT